MAQRTRSGGDGPYLTKDEFFAWKDEYHEDAERRTEKILLAIEKSAQRVNTDCREQSDRNEKRIEKLEGDRVWERFIGLVAAAVLGILGIAK